MPTQISIASVAVLDDGAYVSAGFFIMISATTLAKKVMLRVLPPIYRSVDRPPSASPYTVPLLRLLSDCNMPVYADKCIPHVRRLYPPALRRLWQPPMHTLKVRVPTPARTISQRWFICHILCL